MLRQSERLSRFPSNRGSIIRGMFRKNNEIFPQPERERRFDRAGRSPLHYAAGEHDVNHVKELIQQGEDVNLADRQGWTPLHFAAQSYDAEMADLLLDSGALVDPRDSYGNTRFLRQYLTHAVAAN
jgi:ankyrin repeat protein